MSISKSKLGDNSHWVVTYFSNVHNHELLHNNEVRFLPAYREIHPTDKKRVLLLSKAGCSISLIMRVLELEKNIDPGMLPFKDKDVRNFIQSQNLIGQENDATEVLKLCKTLKDQDADFRYEYTMDENQRLEHIIFAFGDSIRAYEVFGDVVVFDTTYRINRYDMPLGVWVGINNHGNTIFFGCVLLRDERTQSFSWALENFVQFMKGKLPKTILTDQDLALEEAISQKFSNTKHAFCIWHIAAKLSTWFSFPLGKRYEDWISEFYRLYNLEFSEDFEKQWATMVGKFELQNDRHIQLLFSYRASWALCYLKDFFFAGMTTTSRSESINSFLKNFLDARTSLKDFVEQVGVAVTIRNQAGEEAVMRQKYLNIQFKTSMPLEEYVANVLTPYAFDLLQTEIDLSTKYAAYESDIGTFLVRHHKNTDGGRLVKWNEVEESVSCSCKEFEFSGILCRHAVRVLLMKNYFHLPEKYLMSRWKRTSSLILKFGQSLPQTDELVQKLHSLISSLEDESMRSRNRISYANVEIEKLTNAIRCISIDHTDDDETHVVDMSTDGSSDENESHIVENPIISKGKGRPKGSRAKGGVEVATAVRYCKYPNCGGTGHDAHNCPLRKKHSLISSSESPNKIKKGWKKRNKKTD